MAVDFASQLEPEKKKKVDFSSLIKDDPIAGIAGQKELGEPGLKSFRARFNLARADTLKEKINIFQQQFPQGELIQVPVTNEILFREDPSQPFSAVEGPEFEPILDVVDFLGGDLGPLAGEIAATIGTRGANLMPTLIRIFGGAAGGEVAEQAVQEIEGIQEEPVEAVAKRAVGTGTIATTFGVLGFGGGKLLDVARGGGFFRLKEGATEAIESISLLKEKTGIEVPSFTPGEAADNPLVQKIEGQAGATMPTIQRYLDEQNKATLKIFETMRDKTKSGELKGSLAEIHVRARNEILNKVTTPRVELTKGGIALQEGIAKYDISSRFVVNEAYKEARKIQSPTFNTKNLINVVDEVGAGVKGLTPEGRQIELAGALPGELQSVINDIKALDPSLPEVKLDDGTIVTSVDQLRALRSRLWDLKTPPPGEIMRQDHFQAAKVYSAITKTLEKPTNLNRKFISAWKKANKEAATRFDTMEKLIVVQSARSETPAQLAFRLAKPMQVDNLNLLRQMIPNNQFVQFQQSFKTNLLENPENLTRTLESFDLPTLSRLLSPAEIASYTSIGKGIDKLSSVGIRDTLERQSRTGGIIKDLLYRKDTAQIDRLAEIVKKSPNSKPAKSIRSGLIDAIASDVIKDGTLNAKALAQSMSLLEERGLNQFLTSNDKFLLRNLEKIVPFLKTQADTGTSMQAGEAAGGFRGVLTGDVSGAAIRTVMEHVGIGRFFTSRMGTFLLTGTGKERNAKNIAAMTSAIIGTTLADLEETK